MLKLKRSLSLLLIVLLSFFLISCSNNAATNSTSNNTTTTTVEKDDVEDDPIGANDDSMFTTQSNALKATAQTALSTIKIHYIDVGQGDSELIQVDGKNILIDAGTSDAKALTYLKKIGITKLDYVIATHPHEDHIGGMDDVIKSISVGTFYAPKVTTTTTTYKNMVNALQAKNLKITVPTVGSTLQVGGATVTFLAPNSATYNDLNDYSIAVKIKYGNKSFIFMGDAEALSEGEILKKQLDIQADVLKLGHHGSSSSTSNAFLDKVNPQYAIASCALNNDYGHPHKETLDKLNLRGIKLYRTDRQGTIIASSDGKDISFTTQK